jgi:steroid 5-alpha reductase family enzyme
MIFTPFDCLQKENTNYNTNIVIMSTVSDVVSTTSTLVQKVYQSSSSWTEFVSTSLSNDNPVIQTLSVTVLVIIVVYILGLTTGNHSFVDKSWSIVPVYYAWQFGLAELSSSVIYPRAAVASCIITVWGVRLTYNFWRKGGYAWEGEDYRWPVLRERMHPLVYQLFHIVFIAIIQNLLLTSLVVPLYVSWYTSTVEKMPQGFNGFDAAGIVVSVLCLIVESVADQEQWDFHQRKAKKRLHASSKKLGFLTEGLWAHSRHPNFFAEQSFWLTQCLFASAATGRLLGWWLIGPLCLILLFQGSTSFTERITADKYPDYRVYQSRVSRLLPQPRGGTM